MHTSMATAEQVYSAGTSGGAGDTCSYSPPHSPTTSHSPAGSPAKPSAHSGSDHDNSITPTRRNKRKMTEPKRRTDFSIKRICSDSGESVSDDEDGLPAKRLRPSMRASSRNDEAHSRVSSSSTPPIPSPQPSPSSTAARLAAAAAAAMQPASALGLTAMHLPMLSVPNFYPAPLISVLRPDTLEVLQHHHHHQQQQQGRHRVAAGRRGSQGVAGPSPSSESTSSTSPPTPQHHATPSTSRCPATPHPYHDRDLDVDTPSMGSAGGGGGGRRARKNYKNMTRERRVEANARERSRVHTISAAFESLRRAVPSYSYNQRLSKLAILRIACSYITALSRLADLDYSPDQSKPSFAQCVDLCTRTIQAEGRAKRRH